MSQVRPSSPVPPRNPPEAPIFLQAGDFCFGEAPLRLATLLGSCVTVTLWHPRRQIGGMCHFLVPSRPRREGMALDAHYADEAFALFDQAVLASGSQPEDFQAKLFGGGDMFADSRVGSNVGEQNIAAARKLLKQRGIPLLAEHAGGAGHRKLIFDIASGEVQLRFTEKPTERQHG